MGRPESPPCEGFYATVAGDPHPFLGHMLRDGDRGPARIATRLQGLRGHAAVEAPQPLPRTHGDATATRQSLAREEHMVPSRLQRRRANALRHEAYRRTLLRAPRQRL